MRQGLDPRQPGCEESQHCGGNVPSKFFWRDRIHGSMAGLWLDLVEGNVVKNHATTIRFSWKSNSPNLAVFARWHSISKKVRDGCIHELKPPTFSFFTGSRLNAWEVLAVGSSQPCSGVQRDGKGLMNNSDWFMLVFHGSSKNGVAECNTEFWQPIFFGDVNDVFWAPSSYDCRFIFASNSKYYGVYPLVNQHNYGKSPFSMGTSTISGHFQ